jgi:hypothetical protein
MIFTNVEQIRDKFIKDGWSKNISFVELSLEEAKEKGYLFAIRGIAKGEKYFKMNASGNIYNNKGKVLIYNI